MPLERDHDVLCFRMLPTRCEIAHNGTMEGEKNRDWIFHVCRGIEGTGRLFTGKIVRVSFGNDSSFLFLDEWTFYGLLSMIFEKRNLSSFLFYHTYIFAFFDIHHQEILFLFVFLQCIKVFQFILIFKSKIFLLQTRIRKILQNYYKI